MAARTKQARKAASAAARSSCHAGTSINGSASSQKRPNEVRRAWLTLPRITLSRIVSSAVATGWLTRSRNDLIKAGAAAPRANSAPPSAASSAPREVADPEAEVRRLLDYCAVPFEDACLRFYETERAVRTASSEQVRQPIYNEGVDQWRAYEPWLGPLKDVLGPILAEYPSV